MLQPRSQRSGGLGSIKKTSSPERHKHATFNSTMPIIVKNKAHFLHKMNSLTLGRDLTKNCFGLDVFRVIFEKYTPKVYYRRGVAKLTGRISSPNSSLLSPGIWLSNRNFLSLFLQCCLIHILSLSDERR